MKIYLLLFAIMLFSCKEVAEGEMELVEQPIETAELVEADEPTVPDIDLEIYNFESFKPFLEATDGKTYVINFWATWCKPCIKELPYFEKLNAEYKDRDVEVILVSLDFPSKYDSHLKPYIADNKLMSKVIALDDPDSNSWIPKINENWSGAIPATLIFNSDERIFHEGSYTYDELLTEVKPFLN